MACYRDPGGKQRSAGSYTTRRAAERAAVREELKANDGHWHGPTPGKIHPCEETELPKVVTQRRRTLSPEEYRRVLAAVPDKYRLMVQLAVETGLRWGELIALCPRHLDFTHRTLTVEETIVEVPKRASTTGQRMIVKPYPKDNEWRRMGLRPALLDQLSEYIADHDLGPNDLLFATRDGTPISRNTFRTRAWKPAIKASGVDFNVRNHDLRHAHASWLLAGGADLSPSWTAWVTADPDHAEVPPPSQTPTNATSTPSPESRKRP